MATTDSTASPLAIELRGLSKRYRRADGLALDHVDLSIPKGSLFGLLGPNGAGKSTLINILAGLVIKSDGKAWISGYDIDKNPRLARAHIGVVPQELNIDPFFTPRALLDLMAGFYGLRRDKRRAQDLLEALGLGDRAEAYPRTLSGGMRRRLMIAKAMVHNPPVLVLDEPTAGVDIDLRRQLWELVRQLNSAGVTVVLTTHYLEEAQSLCDTIAIIDQGRLITCESTASLLGRLDDKVLRVDLARPLQSLPQSLEVLGAEWIDEYHLRFRYSGQSQTLSRVLHRLCAENLEVVDVHTREPRLEEIFLQLTGRSANLGA
ncbi:MAG: ABC transporter ATP-binding protein [Alphaproteobacteria bacterium]